MRPARPADQEAIAAIILPVIRAGETHAVDRARGGAEARAHRRGPHRGTVVAEEKGRIRDPSYLRAVQSGGHMASRGSMAAGEARGRGVARSMCGDWLDRARNRGFRAMRFAFLGSTEARAVAPWKVSGFAAVGRSPRALDPPGPGRIDAPVMRRIL